jgi:glycosyltransferase involved in cell wall biosynthesis
MARASLIIATRDRAGFLDRTLASLARQRVPDFEVVITDDGSIDETREIVARYRDSLDLRYLRRAHQGRAAARNAAIRAAKGAILCFCDDDRIADPDFVGDHLDAHADGASSVAIGRQRGIVTRWSRRWGLYAADLAPVLARRPELAARLAEPEAELVDAAAIAERFDEVVADHELPEPWWERYVAPVLARYGPSLDGYALPWTIGTTGNLSAPRALVEQVGLLDESFAGWGLEDTELHLRLHRAGARTVILPGARNWHQLHHRPDGQALEWGRNALRLLELHPQLDVCLYLRVVHERLGFEEASRLVDAAAAAGPAARPLVAELVRVIREHLAAITPR